MTSIGAAGFPLFSSAPQAAYAKAKAASYLVCLAAVLVLRDPVLLFASMVTAVSVFFREWWFLYLACSVPVVYHLSETFNVMSDDLASHLVAAASALNRTLNMAFAGVALIAAWPSVSSAASLDLKAALSQTPRFLPISLGLAAKVVVENGASEEIVKSIVALAGFNKRVLDTVVPVTKYLGGFVQDAVGAV